MHLQDMTVKYRLFYTAYYVKLNYPFFEKGFVQPNRKLIKVPKVSKRDILVLKLSFLFCMPVGQLT